MKRPKIKSNRTGTEQPVKKKHKIVIITETKRKLKGIKDLNDYVTIYSEERIITARLKIERGYLTMIGVCATEEGRKKNTAIINR